jgi:hypothetical protein
MAERRDINLRRTASSLDRSNKINLSDRTV